MTAMIIEDSRARAEHAVEAGQKRFVSLKARWMQSDGLRHMLPQVLFIALVILFFITFERLV